MKQALARDLAGTPSPRDIGKPRLPVDRVFTLRGIGTVVTGTLIGGVFRRGQAVVIQPGARAAKVRSLQNHSSDVELSAPGSRTAVNLPDVQSASAGSAAIERGEVITLAELGTAGVTMDVVLEKSARLLAIQGADNAPARKDARPPFKTAAARPLKDGALVRVHHGSGNTPARIHLLDAKQLAPGERALAQLRFESPVFAFVGDRFIVRDGSEQCTLAGGVILDTEAARRQFRTESRRKFLGARAQSPDSAEAFVGSQLVRAGACRRAGLLIQSRFSAAEIADAITRVVAAKQALPAGDWVADGGWWQGMLQRAAGLINAAHKSYPDRPGLVLSELRSALTKVLPTPDLFELLLAELYRNGYAQTGNAIRSAAHKLVLPPNLQVAGARVRTALALKPLEPPSRKELAPDALTQQALRFLLNSGEAVDLSEDVVLLKDRFERAREAVVKFIRERGPATTSDLRLMLGTSRRILIPLLERLDREGVTRRDGDKRSLKKP